MNKKRVFNGTWYKPWTWHKGETLYQITFDRETVLNTQGDIVHEGAFKTVYDKTGKVKDNAQLSAGFQVNTDVPN